ncbi:MAG: DUF488 domain-containing protein [Desulfobacterales bacterium]|nr:DUF488 domain-containing protein [Desulfobacterales bacterium]
MKIYTSYFGFLKNIPHETVPVSIARFPPKWFDGCDMKILAPEKKLLWQAKQGKISEEEYTRQYMAQIKDVHDPQAIYEKLLTEFDGNDIALLCFEKKGEFCHRRLLANWLENVLDIKVPEL